MGDTRQKRQQADTGLICVECGVESPPRAPGWRAYLGAEEDEYGVMVGVCVVIVCPQCAEREFEQ